MHDAMIRTMLVATLAAAGGPALGGDTTVQRSEPQTGIESWEARAPGGRVSVTQITPDQVRAFFLARGLPREATEQLASACVFMTIVRNEGDGPLRYDLSTWRVQSGSALKSREAWLVEWETGGLPEAARIAFEWSQLPGAQVFEPGDWNQGMITVVPNPGRRFDLTFVWESKGERHEGTLRGVRCAR